MKAGFWQWGISSFTNATMAMVVIPPQHIRLLLLLCYHIIPPGFPHISCFSFHKRSIDLPESAEP